MVDAARGPRHRYRDNQQPRVLREQRNTGVDGVLDQFFRCRDRLEQMTPMVLHKPTWA